MKKRMHIISNTHWDREHRHSFGVTRFMLSELMDELVEILESDENYKYFTLDGQSIMLDDYLDIKPYMKPRIENLVKSGKLLVGPWYSLVDCYSVMPESIIRNLLHGHKKCDEFGDIMKVGYSIFSFGQISQLPQIYNGFGIKDILFYKGANSTVFPESEFIWQAPDGSSALASRLGKEKRWNFFFLFTVPVIHGGCVTRPGWCSDFTNGTRLCHMNDDQFKHLYSNELQPDRYIRKEMLTQAVKDLIDDTNESKSDTVRLGFDGTDFIPPTREVPEAIKLANEQQDEMELIHSNPELYFEDFRSTENLDELKKYTGEMRFGPVDSLHSETMGSNIELKIKDFSTENKLISYAEPFSVFAFTMGEKYPHDELSAVWKELFKVHAHDSIHGSGDPCIKEDNLNRLQYISEMSEYFVKSAVEKIASKIDFSNFEKDDICIMVLNPTEYERKNEIVSLSVDLPRNELCEDYWLEDMDGNRVEMYNHNKDSFNLAMIHRTNRPKTVKCDRFEGDFLLTSIPAMGYKLYKIKRVKGDPNKDAAPFPKGVFPYNPIAKNGNTMDNGLLRVTINPNGTLNVYDYETHQNYNNIHYFTDTGCSGDFWVHREPAYNKILSSTGYNAEISIVRNSGLLATCRVEISMNIPKRLTSDRSARSNETDILNLAYEVTLAKDSKRLDFKTTILNKQNEHMLTVSIPTGITSNHVTCDIPFEKICKEVNNVSNKNGKQGDDLVRFAIQSYADITNEHAGVSLMTKGLKELGVTDDNGSVFNLTLLRSVSGTFPVHNDLFLSFDNENSNCLGQIDCEYALLFHNNSLNVQAEAKKYIVPVASAEVGFGSNGTMPTQRSFFNSNINIVGMKLSENKKGIILRLNNPEDKKFKGNITVDFNFKNSYLCNMLEEKIREVAVENSSISFDVNPYEIITLFIEM